MAPNVTDLACDFSSRTAVSLVVWYLVSLKWHEGPSLVQNLECKQY